MKLKYYLRGIGIGVIVTTLILMIAYGQHKVELTDAEIIRRAETLGMVMKEESLFPNREESTEKLEETESAELSQDATENVAEETESTEATDATENLTEQIEETDATESRTEETEQTEETESAEATDATEESETEESSEQISNSESTNGEVYHLLIPPGSVPRLICNELQEQGVIVSASELRQYLVDVGYATSIEVGEYDIPYGATYEEIYLILKAGPK